MVLNTRKESAYSLYESGQRFLYFKATAFSVPITEKKLEAGKMEHLNDS
jgi:hypothetical protein